VVPVLPVMRQESGESDLFGKLEQHQLQQEHCSNLGKSSRPATGGVTRACGPYVTSEINVAPIGTDNSAIRYQRTETRHRRLRCPRSAAPARPDNAAVTKKAAMPAPSDMKTPCNGRPSGKIAESTIGGIARD
jgi:hypothetical protein